MRKHRTVSILAAALAIAGALAAAHAAEMNYPTRPIRIIVPYPPGGSTDPTARAFGNWLSDKFGVSVVIDNRPGAGATLGHGLAAKATPDGYTLLLGTSGGLVTGPAFGTKVPYDPVRDFAPIGLGVYVPFLLVVHAGVSAKNVTELVVSAKSQPSKFNFGSPGAGTPNHLGMELLNALTGTRFVHVPYKGGGPAMVDLLAGRIHALFGGIPYCQPQITAGKIRAIGIGHPTRVRSMPDVPAIAETYAGFNNTTWFGLLAPAATPRAIVTRLNTETIKALNAPEIRTAIVAQGSEAMPGSPEQFAEYIKSEIARIGRIARTAGIKAE